MSSFFPLNANDDGRATTWSWGSFESALMSSSLMPSLRYSSCGAPLTFTNGSTAIDWPLRPAKAGVPCGRDSTKSPAAASRVAASPAPAARRDVRRPVARTRCDGAARASTNSAAVAKRSAGVLARGRRDRPRDPEITHHGMAGFEEDVLRLDVAMHDIMAVGVAQGVRHLPGDLQGVPKRQLFLMREPVSQRFALDVGHDVEEESLRLPGVVERQDVGMVEPSRGVYLAEKPLRAERCGQLGLQDLNGDLAVVLPVLSEVDRRHPPAAELALDRVAVGEGGLQTSEQVGQGGSR